MIQYLKEGFLNLVAFLMILPLLLIAVVGMAFMWIVETIFGWALERMWGAK